MARLLPLIAALWAGALLGGSFIAAPAKFAVESLSLPQLLAVGQAQFQALAAAELALAVLLVGAALWQRPRGWLLVLIPVALFAVQQLGIYPILSARTEARIAGEAVDESHLHLVYVGVELVKFIGLIVCALFVRPAKP